MDDPHAPNGRRYRLLAGLDANKDQSYFLYGLRQDQLAHTRFPLGSLTKTEVREVARRHGLVTADKPESQEICFVPGGDYRTALRDRAGWHETPGPLLGVDGERLGDHRGAAACTIGQQRPGVATGRRYVKTPRRKERGHLGRREDSSTRVRPRGVSLSAAHLRPTSSRTRCASATGRAG
jgi:tRNA-specific 2-thiouridylase